MAPFRPDHGRLHVIVATPLGPGGAGGIDQLMDEIRRAYAQTAPLGLELTFVTTRGRLPLIVSPFVFALAIGRLAWAKARGRADVLHVNLASGGSAVRKVLLCAAARRLRIPYLVHLHGSRYRQFHASLGARRRRATVAMFAHASHVVVLGAVWKRFLAEAGIVAGDHVLVLPNASRAAPLRADGATRSGVTILFLGRVGERKGVPVLIEALAGLTGDTGWRAVIAGDGALAATRANIAARGLEGRVTLTGWIDRNGADRLLGAADILVLPSRDENLPLSVIEGMAHGLAIVATPVGAVPEIIADGRTGLLVPVGDAACLGAALRRVIGDAALRHRLGAAARAAHRDRLEITAYCRQLASIWRDVAASAGAR